MVRTKKIVRKKTKPNTCGVCGCCCITGEGGVVWLDDGRIAWGCAGCHEAYRCKQARKRGLADRTAGENPIPPVDYLEAKAYMEGYRGNPLLR